MPVRSLFDPCWLRYGSAKIIKCHIRVLFISRSSACMKLIMYVNCIAIFLEGNWYQLHRYKSRTDMSGEMFKNTTYNLPLHGSILDWIKHKCMDGQSFIFYKEMNRDTRSQNVKLSSYIGLQKSAFHVDVHLYSRTSRHIMFINFAKNGFDSCFDAIQEFLRVFTLSWFFLPQVRNVLSKSACRCFVHGSSRKFSTPLVVKQKNRCI